MPRLGLLAPVLASVVALGLAPSAFGAPLKATFKPDPSKAVSEMISRERGGALSLSGPRGVRIMVKIPPRALFADTKVTAIPIDRFKVAPVHGGFVAGVQLEPEGLELLKPGSVEFRPRKGLKPARRYFLGSEGSGSGVHLTPPFFHKVGRGRKATLRVVSKPIVPIFHFSTVEGFDWSKANLRDLDAIRFPRSEIDRISHELALLLGLERQRQLLGLAPVLSLSDASEALERARDSVIKPRLAVVTAALKRRCSMGAVRDGRDALMLALGLVRQEQLLGMDPSFDTAALMGPVLKGSANCMLQQCSRYGPRLSEALVTAARQVELIAGDANQRFFDVLLRDLMACSAGEVHLDSTISFDDDDGFGETTHQTMHVDGRSPFEVGADGRSWAYPDAPLEYLDVHGSTQIPGGDCGPYIYKDALTANANGVFRISELDFSPLDPGQPDASPPIEKLVLTIAQDPTEREVASVDCAGQGPIDGPTPHLWLNFFGQNHPAGRAPSFNAADFFTDAAPVIALAVYTGQRPGGGSPTAVLSENTLVEVISKPGEIEPLPDPFG